jgi:hypothetical protein
MRRAILMLVATMSLLGTPNAKADLMDSVNYTITFTGTGTLPTAGSFTYDPDIHTFSHFLVTWDGLNFDLTSAANGPFVTSPAPSCIGSLTGGAASFAVLSGDCTPPPTGFETTWKGALLNTGFQFGFFVDDGRNVAWNVFDDEGAAGDAQPFDVHGQWTISASSSAVPEPSAWILFLTVLLAVAIVKRSRRTDGLNNPATRIRS